MKKLKKLKSYLLSEAILWRLHWTMLPGDPYVLNFEESFKELSEVLKSFNVFSTGVRFTPRPRFYRYLRTNFDFGEFHLPEICNFKLKSSGGKTNKKCFLRNVFTVRLFVQKWKRKNLICGKGTIQGSIWFKKATAAVKVSVQLKYEKTSKSSWRVSNEFETNLLFCLEMKRLTCWALLAIEAKKYKAKETINWASWRNFLF